MRCFLQLIDDKHNILILIRLNIHPYFIKGDKKKKNVVNLHVKINLNNGKKIFCLCW